MDTRVKSVAAGLWHTLCISVDGCVYAFGGNQFGQLGTGVEEAEVRIGSTVFHLLIWNGGIGIVFRLGCFLLLASVYMQCFLICIIL